MSSEVSKEALFNEIKGSLFEYLVARDLACDFGVEDRFIKSIPEDYLKILMSQDLMVRKFYPEMTGFLSKASQETKYKIKNILREELTDIRLVGKLSGDFESENFGEADFIILTKYEKLPVSLKLNKKNSFVNTKSGGIKSFFKNYFPWMDENFQLEFNQMVDREFDQMAHQLHEYHDLEYFGNFKDWVALGFSELPGELSLEEREILKSYYSRIALKIHSNLTLALKQNSQQFSESCLQLIGLSNPKILQVICYHDFQHGGHFEMTLNSRSDLKITQPEIKSFHHTASVEILLGDLELHIRVKPMNKFTTTAMKINCSIKRPKVL